MQSCYPGMFHRSIGADRKIARLRFLRDRWATRVVAESGGRARMLTAIGPNENGAIGVVSIEISPVSYS